MRSLGKSGIARRRDDDDALPHTFFRQHINPAVRARNVFVAAERDVQNTDVIFFAVLQNPFQTGIAQK